MNFNEEPPHKGLVHTNPHLNDVQRAPQCCVLSQLMPEVTQLASPFAIS